MPDNSEMLRALKEAQQRDKERPRQAAPAVSILRQLTKDERRDLREFTILRVMETHFARLLDNHLHPHLKGLANNVRGGHPRIAQLDNDGAAHFGPIDNAGAGIGVWSGVVWYLGERIDIFDTDELAGVYLHFDIIAGTWEFSDELPVDATRTNCYEVGAIIGQDESENNIYALVQNKTVGDIHIDMAPFHAPTEEESP